MFSKKATAIFTGILAASMLFQGNVAEAAYKKDRTPPTAPVITSKTNINAATSANYKIVGKGERGSKVLVVLTDGKNKASKYGVVDKNGNFSVVINAKYLKDGKIKGTSTLTDTSKNTSKLTTFYVNKDTVGPTFKKANAPEYINSKTTSYVVSGVGEKNTNVVIKLTGKKGVAYYKTVVANAKGEFSNTIYPSKFADGTYELSVMQKDSYGNNSEKKIKVVKDTVAPVIEEDIYYSDYINKEREKQFHLLGYGEVGSTVTVRILSKDGKVLAAKTEKSDAITEMYMVEIDLSKFADGDYIASITERDKAGNESKEKRINLPIDTVAPSKPIVETPVNIDSTNQKKYIIKGKGEPGSFVGVAIKDEVDNYIGPLKDVIVDKNGNFQAEFDTSSLLNGKLHVLVLQVDDYDNFSETVVFSITKNV